MDNKWDKLAERFNVHKDSIHKDVAVNAYLGWKTFFDQVEIHENFIGKKNLCILDFGCGAGALCDKFNQKGHKVIGVDSSESMIEIAKKHTSNSIKYITNHHYKKLLEGTLKVSKLDVITAMHSFDFIEEIDMYIKKLSLLLKKDGIIIFAVFPKGHVVDSIKLKDQFEDFDSNTNPKSGFLNFDGLKVPVFVKDPEYYDRLFTKLKFEKILEYYPPFPKEFFNKFHWPGSHYPEMVILSYRKTD